MLGKSLICEPSALVISLKLQKLFSRKWKGVRIWLLSKANQTSIIKGKPLPCIVGHFSPGVPTPAAHSLA